MQLSFLQDIFPPVPLVARGKPERLRTHGPVPPPIPYFYRERLHEPYYNHISIRADGLANVHYQWPEKETPSSRDNFKIHTMPATVQAARETISHWHQGYNATIKRYDLGFFDGEYMYEIYLDMRTHFEDRVLVPHLALHAGGDHHMPPLYYRQLDAALTSDACFALCLETYWLLQHEGSNWDKEYPGTSPQ